VASEKRAVSAVIFDLDGVLLESEQVWAAAKRQLTLALGGSWTPGAERDMLGMSSTEWSDYMREELGLPLKPDEVSAAVAELVAARYREDLPLIPGADAAVRELAGRYPIGLASSSNRSTIDLVVELAAWGDCFSATTSSEEVTAGKPSPDVYLETVRRLGADASSSVAVEDSDVGIRAARAASLSVIAIPNRAYPPAAETLHDADLVLDSIADLPDAVDAGAASWA
jgi:HAD superfamily hydrolase (TIGR01509 family)